MKKQYFIYALIFIISGCVTAGPIKMNPQAKNIIISLKEPGDNYKEIGPISVSHGELGWAKGTYEGAYILLKNKALEMKADYVYIINISDSSRGNPLTLYPFKIEGIAYKLINNSQK